jgi:hypothetical protein
MQRRGWFSIFIPITSFRGFDGDVNCVCWWNRDPISKHRLDAPCSTPHRRCAATDPHPGILYWMRKAAVRRCEHQMHDNGCLPGGGSKVKPCHSDAVEAWGAALSGSTPAREKAPAQPVGLAHQPHRKHPAIDRPMSYENHAETGCVLQDQPGSSRLANLLSYPLLRWYIDNVLCCLARS